MGLRVGVLDFDVRDGRVLYEKREVARQEYVAAIASCAMSRVVPQTIASRKACLCRSGSAQAGSQRSHPMQSHYICLCGYSTFLSNKAYLCECPQRIPSRSLRRFHIQGTYRPHRLTHDSRLMTHVSGLTKTSTGFSLDKNTGTSFRP